MSPDTRSLGGFHQLLDILDRQGMLLQSGPKISDQGPPSRQSPTSSPTSGGTSGPPGGVGAGFGCLRHLTQGKTAIA